MNDHRAPSAAGSRFCTLIVVATLAIPQAAAAQSAVRMRLLSAAQDSIARGAHSAAEVSLTMLLDADSSDVAARSLLAYALAAKGDSARARTVAAPLRLRPGTREVAAKVDSSIERFVRVQRVRGDFVRHLKTGSISRAASTIDSSALAVSERALALGSICVLAGDAECLNRATQSLNGNAGAAPLIERLRQQLHSAEDAAAKYEQEGLPILLGDEVLLNSQTHCKAQAGDDGKAACRRQNFARALDLARDVAAAAPLSGAGLELGLLIAILTERYESAVTAADRLRAATNSISFQVVAAGQGAPPTRSRILGGSHPLMHCGWQAHESSRLQPTGRAVFDRTFPMKPDCPPQLTRFAQELQLLGADEDGGIRLEQPAKWRDGRLREDGSAALVQTKAVKFDVPYLLGMVAFSTAYGEVPARQALRTFGQLLGDHLLMSRSVKLIDSLPGARFRFGDLAKLAQGYASGGLEGMKLTAMEVAARDDAERLRNAQVRSNWISITEENASLADLFEFDMRKTWFSELLALLPRAETGRQNQ